jgi:hypothetical protein
MFSFFRRKGKNQPPPEWANFFTSEEYAAFLAAIDTYFKGIGMPYTVEDGVVRTTWAIGDTSMHNLGLMNVSQMCKQGQLGDYVAIVHNHFDTMRKSQDFIVEFYERISDFEFARPFLGTRIYHKDHVKSIGQDNVVYQTITDDMIAMLVLDMPQAISSVKPSQAEAWGKSNDELLALGLQNIRENYPFEVRVIESIVPLKAVIQDHFFGANIILDFERHPELLGNHGTLVGVPHRHTTLLYPIEDVEVMKAIQVMLVMIHGMHQEGPGSISDCLYWYRQGVFEKLPYEIKEDNTLSFYPTENLVAMLEYLSLEDE